MRPPFRRRPRRPPVRAAGTFDPRVPRSAYDAAQSHGQRSGVLLDGIYDSVPARADPRAAFDRLPRPHRALLVLVAAMDEIYDGALEQDFSNSAADHAARLPDAARHIGAEAYGDLFDRALALFDPERVEDRQYRRHGLDELEREGREQELDALTDELYRLEAAGDVVGVHLERYVDAHPDVFFA